MWQQWRIRKWITAEFTFHHYTDSYSEIELIITSFRKSKIPMWCPLKCILWNISALQCLKMMSGPLEYVLLTWPFTLSQIFTRWLVRVGKEVGEVASHSIVLANLSPNCSVTVCRQQLPQSYASSRQLLRLRAAVITHSAFKWKVQFLGNILIHFFFCRELGYKR